LSFEAELILNVRNLYREYALPTIKRKGNATFAATGLV
jgi:hypothetical protein